MRIVLVFLLLAPVCLAQESFKKLPNLPKGILLRPADEPASRPLQEFRQRLSPCAVEMPRVAPPSGFHDGMAIVAPKTGQDQSKVLNPSSPCKDKLKLLGK